MMNCKQCGLEKFEINEGGRELDRQTIRTLQYLYAPKLRWVDELLTSTKGMEKLFAGKEVRGSAKRNIQRLLKSLTVASRDARALAKDLRGL